MTLKLMHETSKAAHLDSSNKLSKKDVQIGTDIAIMFRKASNNFEETYVTTSDRIICIKLTCKCLLKKLAESSMTIKRLI